MTTRVEEYYVDSAVEVLPGMFQLGVHLRPGSGEPTPVTKIVLVKGATTATNRTGIELFGGATISLKDSDYLDAVEYITVGDLVSYVSDSFAGHVPAWAMLKEFNFPKDYV